jgi:Aspartyl protease
VHAPNRSIVGGENRTGFVIVQALGYLRWALVCATVVAVAFVGSRLSAAPLPPSVALFSTSSQEPVELPAVFDGRVLLHVKLLGKLLWFHLDTGTGGLIIAQKDAAEAGLVFDAQTFRTERTDVQIGAVAARVWFDVLPSYGFEANGRRISGLLGGPFFHANVVTIDYLRQRVIFYPPGSFTPPAGVVATPIQFNGNTPTIEVAFGVQRGRFVVDTGGAVTELTARFAKRVSLGAYEGDEELRGGGGPRHRSDPTYVAPNITFGGGTVRDATVAVGESGGGSSEEGNDGILGRDILSHFAITFDYANSLAYFDPIVSS